MTVHAEEKQTQHWRYLLRYHVLDATWCDPVSWQRAVPLFQWCFLRHRVEKIIADRSQLRPSGSSNRSKLLFEHFELKLATLTVRAKHLQVSVALVMRLALHTFSGFPNWLGGSGRHVVETSQTCNFSFAHILLFVASARYAMIAHFLGTEKIGLNRHDLVQVATIEITILCK